MSSKPHAKLLTKAHSTPTVPHQTTYQVQPHHTPFHCATPPQQARHPTALYTTPHTTSQTHKPRKELESHWYISIFRLLFPYCMQIKYTYRLPSLTHLPTQITFTLTCPHTLNLTRAPWSSHSWAWIWKILWQLPVAFKFMQTFEKDHLFWYLISVTGESHATNMVILTSVWDICIFLSLSCNFWVIPLSPLALCLC